MLKAINQVYLMATQHRCAWHLDHNIKGKISDAIFSKIKTPQAYKIKTIAVGKKLDVQN